MRESQKEKGYRETREKIFYGKGYREKREITFYAPGERSIFLPS